MIKYPSLQKIYNAEDCIIANNQKAIASVMDFWKWAHSDLMDNAERGIFSEYLVAKAIGDKSNHRTNWNSYDLTSSEGIRVEIKTSAYIQSWGQSKLSTLKFGIGKTHGYDNESNQYDFELKRQAEVYVFCVLKETNQEKLNPLDTSQWEFYVLSSKILDNDPNYSNKKSISLQPLIKLGAVKCSYENIHKEIVKAVNTEV